MKVVAATKMKCAAVYTLISLVLYRKHLRCYDRFFQSNPRRHLTVNSLS